MVHIFLVNILPVALNLQLKRKPQTSNLCPTRNHHITRLPHARVAFREMDGLRVWNRVAGSRGPEPYRLIRL